MYACPECGSGEALGVDAMVGGTVDEHGQLQIDSTTAWYDAGTQMTCGACGHAAAAGEFEQEDGAVIKRRLHLRTEGDL